MLVKFQGAGFLLALLLVSLPVFSGCDSFSAVDIGFVGQLTGKFSDIGVAGRNGARMAIEDANAQGGIDGRTIRFHPRDDGNTPAMAAQAVRELADEGCVAVIGPMTSAIGIALAAETEVVMISPTTSSPSLSGKDDLYFRVVDVNSSRAEALAAYAREKLHLNNVLMIGDQDNANYVNTFNKAFAAKFTALGGAIVGALEYSSNEIRNWDELLDPISEYDPDALLLSASARDVAAIARHMKSKGITIPVMCPAWSYTTEVIRVGGDSVEGFIFATLYAVNNTRPEFVDFKKRFMDRFGYQPGFAEAYGYEAAMALIVALRKTDGNAEGLKEALLAENRFKGVSGEFRFDKYGDVKRSVFIASVKNGEFVLLDQE